MIRTDRRDDVAYVTLDRPEKHNALTLDGLADLAAAFDGADGEVRAVVLRGAGDAFCAGDDVASLADLGEDVPPERLGELLYEVMFAPERIGVPVLAAVDGLAYGGGFELVASADLAVATPDATFALPETRVGAYPPYVVARLAAIAGKKRLLELVLTGEPIDAATAREWGLVNRVVAPGDLEDAVGEYVDAIRESPAGATALAKRYTHVSLADAAERERVVGGFARVAACEECRAAARSFLDR